MICTGTGTADNLCIFQNGPLMSEVTPVLRVWILRFGILSRQLECYKQ